MGHLGRTQRSQAASEKKLKAYACELEQKLEARTRELSEAREQQTATSEVLQVISRSPGALEPVFETMLANATRLCEAKFGFLNLYDGDKFRTVALYNVPSAYAETRRDHTFRPHPATPMLRCSGPRRSCTSTTLGRCRRILKVIQGSLCSPISAALARSLSPR